MTLSPKQQLFVDEYLIDFNATQAAVRAGYSKATADRQGPRLLGHVVVSAEIARRRSEIAEKLDVTPEKILTELAKIGFANMQDYMRVGADGDPYLDFSKLSRRQAAALIEVTVEDFTEGRGKDARNVRRVKFKLADKRAALVDLGKFLGMDKAPQTQPDGSEPGDMIDITPANPELQNVISIFRQKGKAA